MLTEAKKKLLLDAWDYCDKEDKSTEFMIAYMIDISGLEHEEVMDFLLDYYE